MRILTVDGDAIIEAIEGSGGTTNLIPRVATAVSAVAVGTYVGNTTIALQGTQSIVVGFRPKSVQIIGIATTNPPSPAFTGFQFAKVDSPNLAGFLAYYQEATAFLISDVLAGVRIDDDGFTVRGGANLLPGELQAGPDEPAFYTWQAIG